MVDTEGGDVKRWARSLLGTTIKGKYRLDDVIGVGGMAVVFRATHRNQAEFAVKMLLPELSFRQDLKTRFLREGYAANSVKHPGVVRVVDDDIADDGAAFLVMDLLQGEGVDALWARQNHRVPVMAAVGILEQLLDVLAAAHEKGIIHRDIKPANLFLTTDGTLKVLDFGIARVKDAVASGAQGTHTGMLLGTPAFMAPEQAKGLTNEIDARTDVWAAGATLFTLVCGEFVHRGETSALLLINSATTVARSIASAAAHVPPQIAAVADKALAFDKADRWTNGGAMRDALREAHRTTYGALPSRDSLLASLTNPPTAASEVVLPQQTIRLPLSPAPAPSPVLAAAFVGGTTAQPVSNRELPRPRRSMLPFAIGAGVFVAAGIAITAVATHHASPMASQSTNAPASAPPSSPTSLSIEATNVLPQAHPTSPSAAISADVVPPRIPTSTQRVPSATAEERPSATAAPRASTVAVRPAPNCDPPFTMDAAGHKIFKKECL